MLAAPPPGWRSAAVNAAIVLASVVFGLAAGEIGLRVAGRFQLPPAAADPASQRIFDDPLLKRRGNPAFPEHDSRGFRNPVALDRADVILFGDSMTYGFGVFPDETWGHVLATETGAVVYNMAFLGWGPRQAAFFLPDALALKPKTVLYGFFLGNDVLDTLEAPAPDAAGAREASADARPTLPCQAPPATGVRGFVRRHSRIYGLVRNSRIYEIYGLVRNLHRTAAPPSPEYAFFDDAKWRTVLTPFFFCSMDDSDPWIRDGVEIALSIVLAMARDVEDAGAAFAVALLPTKESVFAPRVADLDAYEDLAALVAAESRLRDELTDVLRANGVPVLDFLPPLRGAPEQPYPVGRDGHPNVAGHRAIGIAMARFVRGMR